MKKLAFLLLTCAFILYVINSAYHRTSFNTPKHSAVPKITSYPTTTQSVGLFVPDWTIKKTPYTISSLFTSEETSEYYYFGVSINKDGTLRSEGSNTSIFFGNLPVDRKIKTFVTFSMSNSFDNLDILAHPSIQESIISNGVAFAKRNGFDGIVVDLEVTAFPSDALKNQIAAFITQFSHQSHKAHLLTYTTVFGDVMYRERPYELEKIASSSDKLLVMAYDFNKSHGSPGPNFPLNGDSIYGYSLHTLITDLQKSVPLAKVEIVFGLYGYEWTTDEKLRPLKAARAFYLSATNEKRADCNAHTECSILTDQQSAELHMSWKDAGGYYHHYWTDTAESIRKKIALANALGISSIGFWAHGYY